MTDRAGAMTLDPEIRKALDDLGVGYTIEKSRDHYFARVAGHPRIIVAGNHGKNKHGERKGTLRDIRRLKERLER
jgi:hypothetical protein